MRWSTVSAMGSQAQSCRAKGRSRAEIAAEAGLLMEKGAGVAAVVVRGVSWQRTNGRGRDLIRPAALDLFR